jgi:vitamin B12 transporter
MINSYVNSFGIKCILSTITSIVATAKPEDLEPMVIIETRTAQPLSETSPWVTRISGEDLDRRQIYNLADALRSVPGMAIMRTGQAGAQTSLFSRGSQSDHVSFLYAGRKLNGGFSGTYNLGQIALNGVGSVEVLRGSSSVQYGAEGIGGAVMIRSQTKQNRMNWVMEVGSNHSFFNRINSGFDDSGWEGSIGASLYATDNEQPYSQFDSQSGSFHLSRQVSENLKFDFLSLGSKSNVNYPGNVKSFSYPIEGQFQEIEEILISPGVQIKIEDWKVKAFYCFSEDNLVGKDSFSDTTYDADTNALDFQVNGAVTDGVEIVLGGSYEEESFYKKENSTNIVDINKKADSESIFALSTFSYGEDFSLVLGARHDNFSDYGSASTWSALLEKDLFEDITFVTRYSTSFSPPQANDLYGVWGNPDLKPEKADSWEVGLIASPHEIMNLRLTYFDTTFEDLIDWSGFTTANVGTARSKGLETSLDLNQEGYSSRLSFSYLEAENSSTSERLLRRPRIMGNLVVQHANNERTLGIGLKLINDVMDIDGATFSTITGDDYAIMRLFGDYQITETIKLVGRIENLMDENYEEVDGYPALGRAVHAGLSFSF